MFIEQMGVRMRDDEGWGALLAAAEAAPDAPVTFVAGGRLVPSGQHVTEARLARIEAIDCGGRRRAWDEVQMQVLDGPGDEGGGAPMRGRALAGLMRRSAGALAPAPGTALRLEVETGAGLGRFSVGAVGRDETGTTIRLDPLRAVCAPSIDLDCCRPRPSREACCG